MVLGQCVQGGECVVLFECVLGQGVRLRVCVLREHVLRQRVLLCECALRQGVRLWECVVWERVVWR